MKKIKIMITAILFIHFTPGISQEIHDVAQQGDLEKLKSILDDSPQLLKAKDRFGRTPLHLASNAGHLTTVKYLHSRGADLHTKSTANTSALHFASTNGHIEVVQYLIENGTSIDEKNIQMATPMYYAAAGGHENVVEYLIDRGAEVDALDREEGTPLHAAALAGHLMVVTLLMDRGADEKKKDTNGLTALHFACREGKTDVVEFLIQKELKIDDPDHSGKTPLYHSAQRGHNDVVELLTSKSIKQTNDKCLDGSTLLHAAAAGGQKELAEILLKNGSNLHMHDLFGTSPLHLAAQNGHTHMIEFLMENGANINESDGSGKTPYHMATESGHDDAAKMLITRGGDSNNWHFPVLIGEYIGQEPPGMEPELFAPGIISTRDRNERDVSFSSDGNEFYFTLWGNNQPWNITVMKRQNNQWTAPERASFSGQYLDAEAFFTPDNNQIFFISNRPQNITGNPGTWEIWHTERKNDGWSGPILLGGPFEGGFYTTFTNDWVMYYTLNNDLHRARYINRKFEKPEKLDEGVNSENGEYNAFIAPDESYIIFTSFRPGDSFGEGDLFISFRKADGTWTPAMNMGPGINSFARDYCPSVSPDGQYFFFSSRRYGTEDIFWVDAKIVENLKPKER